MSVKSSVEVLQTGGCNNRYRLQIVMLLSVACRWRHGEPIQQACQSPVIKDALNQDTSTPFSSAQAFTITAWQATGKQMSLQSRHLCCWWQAVGRKAYCVPTANELSDSLHHSQGLPVWQCDMIWTRVTSYQKVYGEMICFNRDDFVKMGCSGLCFHIFLVTLCSKQEYPATEIF